MIRFTVTPLSTRLNTSDKFTSPYEEHVKVENPCLCRGVTLYHSVDPSMTALLPFTKISSYKLCYSTDELIARSIVLRVHHLPF